MTEFLKILEDNRDLFLLTEIGVLIHDLGKLSFDFIDTQSINRQRPKRFDHHLILQRLSKGGDPYLSDPKFASSTKRKAQNEQRKGENNICLASPYDYQLLNSFQDVLNDSQWEAYLKDKNNLVETKRLADFIEMHHWTWHPQYPSLINLIRAGNGGCDGIDSGVDKGAVHKEKTKQPYDKTYITTAFGYEKTKKIDTAALANLCNTYATVLAKTLKQILNEKNKGGSISPEKWKKFFYCPNGIRATTEAVFLKALGETRRSANDVTLWDHSYSVAGLYKSALAKVLIDGKPTPPIQIKWRILRVNLDILSTISKAHKIGDILGYRAKIEEAIEEVKRLIEIDYPLGNELYRDESGIYFTCPDVDPEHFKPLKPKIIEVVHRVEKELSPVISISQQPSRSLTILASEISEKAFQEITAPVREESLFPWHPIWKAPSMSDHEAYQAYLSREIRYDKVCYPDENPLCKRPDCILNHRERPPYLPPIDICPICRLRPKCVQQEFCKDCFERREGRVPVWLGNPKTTIWLDEVADHHDRIAIITGQFDLFRWLNGTYTDTLFSQTIADWGKGSYKDLIDRLEKALNGVNINALKIFEQAAGEAWGPYKRKLSATPSQKEIQAVVEQFYSDVVDERDARLLSDPSLSIPDKARLLALFLFRKHPSPARLRRIWNTTLHFWNDTINDLLRNDISYGKGTDRENLRRKRLLLIPGEAMNLPHLAYEGEIGGVAVSVYWDGKVFTVIENLQLLGERLGVSTISELPKRLKGQRLALQTQRGTRREQWKSYLINKSSEAPVDFQDYLPFIPILESPISFIVLFPAWDAFEIVRKIGDKYTEHFSKVRNRLPLSLGMLVFHRRLPLYAAMDAAKRLISSQRTVEPQHWEVMPENSQDPQQGKLRLRPIVEGNAYFPSIRKPYIEWNIDINTEDGGQDYFYPNFIMKKGKTAKKLELRGTRFQSVDKKQRGRLKWMELIHVTELEKGDVVQVTPSRFDFEFLDTTSRRFAMMARGGRRSHALFGPEISPRPYLLEDVQRFEDLWKIFVECARGRKLTDTTLRNVQTLLASKFEAWELAKASSTENELNEYNNRWKAWIELVETTLNRDFKGVKDEDKVIIKDAILDGLFFDCLELNYQILKKTLKEEVR